MQQYDRELGSRVRPRSVDSIKSQAQMLRELFGIEKDKYVRCDVISEMLIHMDVLHILDDDDKKLLNRHALTLPDKDEIFIRDSVYNELCRGNPRARFTLAHEIGHWMMHKDQSGYARLKDQSFKHKVYEDSEWQADTYASHLLIDERLLTANLTIQQIASEFGVSMQAAKVRLEKFRMKKPA